MPPTTMIDRIRDVLTDVLAESGIAVDEITPDVNLFSVGLDSLSMIEFLLTLETRLGMVIPFESIEYDDLESLRSLERALLRL